ncbi:hypothetical protein JCM1841_000730 [Sporobolomyces salmonicolor]
MPPIKLLVANQKTYLWDLHDIQTLRVQHHICGSLQGTLPQVTQQNVFLGLPLVLLPEEVVLLVRNQIAVLVDDPAAHLPPSLAQSTAYAASRAAAIRSQQEASRMYDLEKRKEMEELHRDKIEKKRKEKEAKRKGRDDAEKALEQDDGEVEGEPAERVKAFEVIVPDLVEGEQTTGLPASAPSASTMPSRSAVPTPPRSTSLTPSNLPPTSTLPYTILIDPSSSSYAWYHPSSSAVSYPTIEAAQQAGVWNYPTNELQEARCRVFEDLWRKGYYMGGGLRFGGDFLVYPGDPLRYHSHFTLTVLSTPLTTIMPLDLVAYGRLATAVKKAHLLASYDADKGAAEYLSLEWAAFG